MPRALLALLLLGACSSPAPRPAPAPPAPPVATTPPPPPAPVEPSCASPSRLCDLVALSRSAKLDELAVTLYGAAGADVLAKLRAKRLEALVVDPGIVLRLDEALAFPVQPGEGPWQFRARFADQLGKVRVYRGLAVTPEELASIGEKGILATSLRGAEPVPPYHVMDQLLGHLMGVAGAKDTMLSVSYDPDVSRCVAGMFARKEKQKTIHVWTVELPALDVLAMRVPSVLCPAVEPGTLNCEPPTREITEETRRYACRNFYDSQIESFVQGRIDPAEYVEVKPETRTDDCGDVMQRVRKGLKERKAEQEKFCAPRAAKPPAAALPR